MSGLYVSSKLRHRAMWLASGLPMVSSWVQQDQVEGHEALSAMWDRYFEELEACSGFVLYLEPGDVPKGALVELGAAIAHDRLVTIVWDDNPALLEAMVGTVIHHANVRIVKSIEEVTHG